MEKSKKDTLRLLKSLEKIFPEDIATAKNFDYIGDFDKRAIKTLKENGLIEEKQYSLKGLPRGEENKAIFYKITSNGIEFLNGLKQKRTNILLLILTIALSLIGIIQIIILLR